jgi:class 3 adenylate cyclase
MTPETHYAKSGDVHIAFQVVGEGPLDLVFVPGFISNLDHAWDSPVRARFLTRLATFSRLILFDKRGTGLSDRVTDQPDLEERMDDVRAVMDAVDSKQAALFGISEGGPMSMLFAATYPERTRALALYGSYANFNEWVLPPDRLEEFIALVERGWGTGVTLQAFAPSLAGNDEARRQWAQFERLGASPAAVVALMRMNAEIDTRHIAPAIRVPTVVIHRTSDTRVSVLAGRYLGEHIPGAKYVEIPGVDHLLYTGNTDLVADEIEEFLTGTRSAPDLERVLATVSFCDIVDSTRQAEALGDSRWRALLDQHDEIAGRSIDRFRGQKIKSTGDGFLATFDGPARAVRCIATIGESLRALGITIRSGIHTGEIKMKNSDVSGIAVHIAARVAALAEPGELLVSGTVRDLVAGSGLRFQYRGTRRLKGITEEVRLFSLERSAMPQ